jgi:hypothetical protein
VEEDRWPDGSVAGQDLYEHLTSEETAELIFGGVVNHRSDADGHFLEIGDYPSELKVIRLNSAAIKQVEDYAPRSDSSLYEVELASTIEPGKSAYCRIRWRVFGAGPLWRWKRSSGGARMDLRICDVRDSQHAAIDRHLRSRILSIEEANVFLMASPLLQLGVCSPEVKYLRTLEPRAWSTYLRGAQHRGRVRGLVVYYWKYPGSSTSGGSSSAVPSVINSDRPFRVYLDLNRIASSVWWAQVGRIIIGVAIALLLISVLGSGSVNAPDLQNLDWVTAVQLLLGGALVSWLSTLERLRSWSAGRFLKPRLWWRRLERRILAFSAKS